MKVAYGGSELFQRKIDKLTGGAVVDWDDRAFRRKLYDTISKVNNRGALRLKRKAKSIVRQHAYDTGALYRSIQVHRSKHQSMAAFGRDHKVATDWILYAGDDEVDYVGHVELGRYFKDTRKRIAAVPFMRQAAADTRRWMRPRMIAALRSAIK